MCRFIYIVLMWMKIGLSATNKCDSGVTKKTADCEWVGEGGECLITANLICLQAWHTIIGVAVVSKQLKQFPIYTNANIYIHVFNHIVQTLIHELLIVCTYAINCC